MKKGLLVFMAVVFLFACFCAAVGVARGSPLMPLMLLRPQTTDLGVSERFSKQELQVGAALARDFAQQGDGVLRVVKIRYDEERADRFWETDYARGRFQKENTMVFYLCFVTGRHTGSLNPLDYYTDFGVTLTRDRANGGWRVADAGY